MRIKYEIFIKRNKTLKARANYVEGRDNLKKKILEFNNRSRIRIIGDTRENRLLRV